jgi:site-specific recombinase XerD
LVDVSVCVLDDYVEVLARLGFSRSHLSVHLNGVRGFLRYVFAEGLLEHDVAEFVDRPTIYREATVPPHFTWEELEQLMASVKGSDPIALRDRAMLLLLCVYGLRSEEVAGLTLDDIDWKHATLCVRSRKNNQPLMLPLVSVVAAMLADYIQRGRPGQLKHRRLLVTATGTPVPRGVWITTRLHTLVERAGLRGSRGAHAIRRAVGTRLVEQGFGIGAVAQVLGHQRLSSTRVYLRLSMELLRDVAENYGQLL